MGLTKEQWKEKRLNELYDYVKKHGHKIKDVVCWDTYPICVRDICVLSVAIINDGKVAALFDLNKNPNKRLQLAKIFIETYGG